MTTFMDSAWYFLRFCDPQNEHAIFDPALVQAWLPVDYYVGGKEHAVGHLLYSRFITQVLAQHGLLDLARGGYGDERSLHDEPFRRLFNQGIVHKDGAKMSKSKGNVVSADELAETYGADTARLFSFFGGPYDMDLEWSKAGVDGCHRFLKRVWRLAYQISQAGRARGEECGQHDAQAQQAVRARHRAVAGVSADLQAWRFNTAIAKLMEYLNELEELWRKDGGIDDGRAFHAALQTMAQLLCPFAPHIAEELWAGLGGYGLCCDSEWPEHDPAALVEDTVEYPVQVNGKLRGKVSVPSGATADAVLAAAKSDPAVAKWLEGQAVVKEIVVPGRMVTFVVK
jgi:leucyl-tRNA synthetase